MINNFHNVQDNSHYSFTARGPLSKNVRNVKRVFFSQFNDIAKPSEFHRLSNAQVLDLAQINDAGLRLKVVREFCRTAFEEGGNYEVFRRLIGMVLAFKVGNCSEFAELGKTVCKMNNIKDCDIFSLHAKAPDGTIRSLDHMTLAFRVPKSKNSVSTKQKGALFTPSDKTPVLDLFMKGFFGNVKRAKKAYSYFGLKPDEKLLFRPEKTYEPTLETLQKLRLEFPKLVIKKDPK